MQVRAVANGNVVEMSDEQASGLVAAGIYEPVHAEAVGTPREGNAPPPAPKKKPEPKEPKKPKQVRKPREYKRRDMQAES